VADTIVMQVGGAGRAAAQGARLALDPWSAGCRRGQSQDECAERGGSTRSDFTETPRVGRVAVRATTLGKSRAPISRGCRWRPNAGAI